MNPKVSVVIPAYNHERFIGAAIESVLGQSYGDLELIIINDGSTDGTDAVIRGYRDPRISYFVQENQDAYNTINRGMRQAAGEYISILNSDDIYAENRLEVLLNAARRSEAQCLFTDVIPISDEGEVFADPEFGWNIWHRKNRSFHEQCGDLYTAFLKGNFMVTTSNLFMTKAAAEGVGEFCSLRYLHDYDFIFRMLLAFPGRVEYLKNEKLLYYRIHEGNTLGEAAILGREQDKEVIRKYMLCRVPPESVPFVEAGTDRLVELEQELHAVRASIEAGNGPSIRHSAKQLLRAIKNKFLK